MCTAATYKTKDFYFGRTLDYEFSYGDEVVVTPRNYQFNFKNGDKLHNHYAITGMAYVTEDYPLYYDAFNEKGLAMAGLNFVGNACFNSPIEGKDNIAVFEFIQWVLCKCASVAEVIKLLENINLTDIKFNANLPVSPLHWLIADKDAAITVECTAEGLNIYDNPVGVLTNNPPFDKQIFNLNNYRHLSAKNPKNTFGKLDLDDYSRGMGGMGLPGDLSSQSRFVRVAFTKMNSVSGEDENSSISQFFHILGSVDQQRGCCDVGGKYEITIYTSCCNVSKGIYYYTTYENSQVTAVDMYRENLDDRDLKRYPVEDVQQIKFRN